MTIAEQRQVPQEDAERHVCEEHDSDERRVALVFPYAHRHERVNGISGLPEPESGDVEAGNDEKHVDVDRLPPYSGRLTGSAVSTSACPRHEREVLLENEVVQEQSRDIKVCADVIEVAMRLTALVLWHDKPC